MAPAREEPQHLTVTAAEPAVAPAVTPAPVSAGPVLSAAGVLRMQRAAGNAAVSRMLARSKDPSPAAGPAKPKTPKKPGDKGVHIINNDVPSPAWLRANGFRYRRGTPEMWINDETGEEYWVLSPPSKEKREEPAPPPAPDAAASPPLAPEEKDMWEPHDEDSGAIADARDAAAQMYKRAQQLGPVMGHLKQLRAAGEGRSDQYDNMLGQADGVLRELNIDIAEFNAEVPDWREEIRLSETEAEELPELEKLIAMASGAGTFSEQNSNEAADLRANREPPEQPAPNDSAEPQHGQTDPGEGAGGGGADEGQGGGGGQPAE